MAYIIFVLSRLVSTIEERKSHDWVRNFSLGNVFRIWDWKLKEIDILYSPSVFMKKYKIYFLLYIKPHVVFSSEEYIVKSRIKLQVNPTHIFSRQHKRAGGREITVAITAIIVIIMQRNYNRSNVDPGRIVPRAEMFYPLVHIHVYLNKSRHLCFTSHAIFYWASLQRDTLTQNC